MLVLKEISIPGVSLCCLFVIAMLIVSSIIHRRSEYINRTGTVHGQEVHAAPVKFSAAPGKNLTSILAFKFLNDTS